MAKQLPSIEEINDLLRYEPETGRFYWNKRRCGTVFGKQAGTTCEKGYTRIKINGSLYLAHRLAWKITNGIDPHGKEVDHIDLNPDNNRPDNLRLADHGQNQSNGKAYSTNKNGMRGVHWHKQHQKYCVSIQHKKKARHLGLFDDLMEAANAYDRAAIELFGEFANLNNFKESV